MFTTIKEALKHIGMQGDNAILISVIVVLASVIGYLYKQQMQAFYRSTEVMAASKDMLDTIVGKIEGVWMSARHEIELQNRNLADVQEKIKAIHDKQEVVDDICSDIHREIVTIKDKFDNDYGRSKKSR
jgi:hypothetical protein